MMKKLFMVLAIMIGLMGSTSVFADGGDKGRKKIRKQNKNSAVSVRRSRANGNNITNTQPSTNNLPNRTNQKGIIAILIG